MIFARSKETSTARAGLLVAMLGVLLSTSSVSAEEQDASELVLRGPGGSTTDFRLTRDLALRGSGALFGGGQYAAVLVESLDAVRTPLGLLQVRAFKDGTDSAVAHMGATRSLPAGRYRLTVLGAAPVTARFPLADPDVAGVLVTARTQVAARLLTRTAPLGSGASEATVALRDGLPAGRRAIVATLLRGVRADRVDACATAAGSTACSAGASGQASVAVDGSAQLVGDLIGATASSRDLRFAVAGTRQAADRLRAVAIVF